MIILREKIKNEQGLDLLRMLGETWNYFFQEILPTLQAMLHPLTSLLANEGESVRSLSLLAFRNIVVLRVPTKEALDAVEKKLYPSSVQQMLLILQNVQDNVFLSENHFLLEKLLARVINPYLGQRGLYEGDPTPVIKVKLNPSSFNPVRSPPVEVKGQGRHSTTMIGHLPSHSHREESFASPGGYVGRKNMAARKLKPVLEHGDIGGRRHSVVS